MKSFPINQRCSYSCLCSFHQLITSNILSALGACFNHPKIPIHITKNTHLTFNLTLPSMALYCKYSLQSMMKWKNDADAKGSFTIFLVHSLAFRPRINRKESISIFLLECEILRLWLSTSSESPNDNTRCMRCNYHSLLMCSRVILYIFIL